MVIFNTEAWRKAHYLVQLFVSNALINISGLAIVLHIVRSGFSIQFFCLLVCLVTVQLGSRSHYSLYQNCSDYYSRWVSRKRVYGLRAVHS